MSRQCFWRGLKPKLKEASRHKRDLIRDFDQFKVYVRGVEQKFKSDKSGSLCKVCLSDQLMLQLMQAGAMPKHTLISDSSVKSCLHCDKNDHFRFQYLELAQCYGCGYKRNFRRGGGGHFH